MDKFKNILNKFFSNNLLVFIFFLILILLAYHNVFNSYFESDEWFYLTYYLPLTKASSGLLTAIVTIFTKSGYISGDQHVVPVAALIYFLNVKFFGLNFAPYAFMSLLVHSINSFLVFRLIKTLLSNTKKSYFEKNIFAFLGSLFFAISPVPMHSITGFAFFYGQNVLSVTFFLLCITYYEQAFIKGKKKFILLTAIFLSLAIFTQESASFLFFVLPIQTIFKKKTFSYKFLNAIFFCCLIAYLLIRFAIPSFNYLSQKIVDHYISLPEKSSQSHSIYANLPAEITFRSITFPLRMVGSIFIPRDTNASIAQFLAPIISPYPPGGDPTTQFAFLYYSGQTVIIYLLGLSIIIYCLNSIVKNVRQKQYAEANFVATGLAIIMFGALPLVALIFVFPLWGYDIYFDSRYYYNPEIGAAILFPFLVFGIAGYISKKLHTKKLVLVVFFILLAWLITNINVFGTSIKAYTRNYTIERKAVIAQLTNYLPKLKSKTVFYIEIDGKGPFVSLPFFTSVPQALSVVYFYRNPLPDSFYSKALFSGNPQGYQYENGRGFGYYISKKELFEAIKVNKFTVNDVYGFYYYGKDSKLKNITTKIRKEINNYIIKISPDS